MAILTLAGGLLQPQVQEPFIIMVRQSWDHQPHKRSFSAMAGIHEVMGPDAGGFVFQRQSWDHQPHKRSFPAMAGNISAIGNLRLRMHRGQ